MKRYIEFMIMNKGQINIKESHPFSNLYFPNALQGKIGVTSRISVSNFPLPLKLQQRLSQPPPLGIRDWIK